MTDDLTHIKHDSYMLMAHAISQLSPDIHTKVGAVIVANTGEVLSAGYNTFPRHCADNTFPLEREAESEYDTKYPYICHAELNAVLNFLGSKECLSNASIYTTLFPCHGCAQIIAQVGISKVYYDHIRYRDTLDYRESKRILDAAGILCIQHKPSVETLNNVVKHIQTPNYKDIIVMEV